MPKSTKSKKKKEMPKSIKSKKKETPLTLMCQRSQLPIFKAQKEIMEKINNNQITILVGETGSGKTTQVPQFIYKNNTKDKIIVTQPRRVAAVSIAKRVSEEIGCKIGSLVGYKIRFEQVACKDTAIKFCTDGMLLRELLNDPLLSNYNVIILDEAHERTLRTDILFGTLKGILAKRSSNDFKVVIMSATLNAKAFSEFFNKYVVSLTLFPYSAPIISVPGRQHSVSIFYAPEKQSDYLDSALIAIFQIHKDPEIVGDILVFLTGQEDIENLELLITEQAKALPTTCLLKPFVCPLYSSLPSSQQAKVFEKTPEGCRKIVLATNIAETSITISGIRHVIDTGLVKLRGYNSKTGIETLQVTPISKASARQRAGRAGREAPGFCYRLYPESAFLTLAQESVPEIKRCNLSSVVLLLKSCGVNDIVGFDFMDAPPRAALIGALEQLYTLGALDTTGKITELGRKMSLFPVDPAYAKVIISSVKYKCSREAIDIVSMLSIDPVFFTPADKRDEVAGVKKRFLHFEGDHLTLLNVLRGYLQVDASTEWCKKNFINSRSMKQIMDIRAQLNQFCKEQDIDASISCGQEPEPILECFLSGFFKNVALRQHDGTFKTLYSREIVHIHPSSVLFQTKQPIIMFNEWVETSRQYLRNASLISPSWVAKVAPHIYNVS